MAWFVLNGLQKEMDESYRELAQSQAFMNKQDLNLFRGRIPYYFRTCLLSQNPIHLHFKQPKNSVLFYDRSW